MSEIKRGKGRPREFDRDAVLHRALEVFWKRGFEPAKVTELCRAMGLNPPSLYAAFGSKQQLFLEAVDYYQKTYWEAPIQRYLNEPDICRATDEFFRTAARILRSPETPCGCMVALSAINISPDETAVINEIHKRRMAVRAMFTERLLRAVKDGQLPPETDAAALAAAFHTMAEGLAMQARDGLASEDLERMAAFAVRLLPASVGH